MRFVVQHPELQDSHLLALARPLGGATALRLNASAAYFVLHDVAPSLRQTLADYCQQHALDYAFVADEQTLAHFGLAVMDMDSTMISIECIDEIADMYGLKPQISQITESAMRGEIEFAESLRRRVALLAGLHESALQRVIDERLQLNPGAQAWVDACKQHGIQTLLVSGGFDFFTSRVQAMTGLDHTRANRLDIVDGKLTGRVLGNIVDAQAKADFLLELQQQLGLRQDQVIAIGDGANDLKMMAAAGAGIAYHAKPIVREQATYALNHVGLDGVINLFTTV